MENEQTPFENTLSRRLRALASEVAETIATARGAYVDGIAELSAAIVAGDLLTETELADMDDHDPITFARLVVIDFVNAERAAAGHGFDRENDELGSWINDQWEQRRELWEIVDAVSEMTIKHGRDPARDVTLADWIDDELTRRDHALARTAEHSTAYHDIKRTATANGWRGLSDGDLINWIDDQSNRNRRAIRAENVAGSIGDSVKFGQLFAVATSFGYDPDADEPIDEWFRRRIVEWRNIRDHLVAAGWVENDDGFGDLTAADFVRERVANDAADLRRASARLVSDAVALFEQIVADEMGDE